MTQITDRIQPPPDSILPLRTVAFIAVAACSTPLILVASIRHSLTPDGVELGWLRALAGSAFWWYGWAMLSVPLIRMGVSRPLFESALRNAPLHAGLFASILLFHPAIVAFGNVTTWPLPTPIWEEYKSVFLNFLEFEVLYFCGVTAISQALAFKRRETEERALTLAIESELSDARYRALTSQLHPHFLFNALHAISSIVSREPEVASRMTERLADLLRQTLQVRDEKVPLSEEIRLLTSYLEIEHERFPDRLEVEIRIQPDVNRALVPWLILQPIVENAVRHGIAPYDRAGKILVEAMLVGKQLRIRVTDDGPGARGGQGPGEGGIGLSNTRLRMRQLFGDRQSVTFGPLASAGYRVEIRLPLIRSGNSMDREGGESRFDAVADGQSHL